MSLTKLAAANRQRMQEWEGADKIDLAFQGLELGGEVGELQNLLKKLIRLERGISGTKETSTELLQKISDELGDTVICASLIANALGLDLAACVTNKFNATSAKHNLYTRLFE